MLSTANSTGVSLPCALAGGLHSIASRIGRAARRSRPATAARPPDIPRDQLPRRSSRSRLHSFRPMSSACFRIGTAAGEGLLPSPCSDEPRAERTDQRVRQRLRIECAISSSRASQSGRSSTNAIERLHEEFKRRIKTQTVLPSAETAAMLFWALLASGQINMRKVDGWQTLATPPIDQPIDLAA